ncbi:MAG: hypothetical protein COB53_02665 [Elusimicrobia bacterium]|nr:MAG: hypothetical protein COB53_02665 [Elusimicrobiota bacterium]
MPPFPPLYHLSIRSAMDAEDPASAALWVNVVYMGILLLSIWGLGRIFYGDWAGFGAAALFSCFPEVQWLFRETLADLPLIAWTAASYWALFASRRFVVVRYSALFGLFAACGMLTKWSAFSYYLPVLWIAWEAWRGIVGRRGLGVALAVFVLLVFPWYLIQWPILLPRLIGASADGAVPVWKGLSVLSYVFQLGYGFGFPAFLLTLASLFAPWVRRRSGDMGFLLAWLAGSYVFWTIVPNRQLRYLLPGLIPMAVLAMGPWPKALRIGVIVFQLVAAANYGFAYLPPLNFHAGLTISLFRSAPPQAEDWKIGEILKAAEARRDRSSKISFSNLALVSNTHYFNGPTFNYERKRHRVEGLRIRGVNRRYVEFCEFVVVKTESLGPASVIGQLGDVRSDMMDPKGWFQRGYREIQRFPLPDKSEAVLFQRRKLKKSPFLSATEVHYQFYSEKSFEAEKLTIRFGRWSRLRGAYDRVMITTPLLKLRGLEIRNVKVIMEGLSLIPTIDWSGRSQDVEDLMQDFRFLKMDRLILASAEVSESAAAEFLQKRVNDISGARFSLEDDISASARWKGVPVAATVSLVESKQGLQIGAERLSAYQIPLPLFLLGGSQSYFVGFAPTPELPFKLQIANVSIADGKLKIGR